MMIHWLQPSQSPGITKYIECYWFIEKYPDSKSYQYPKLNPDPSAHLIISPKNQTYHYDLYPEISNGKGSHWIFPHHRTFQLDHTKPFVHLGVKFHVGALYALDIPAYSHPMLDTVKEVDLSTLLNGNKINENSLIKVAQNNADKCCEQMDAIFLPWITQAKEDKHSEITQRILQLLDTIPISELEKILFCSQRTLERSFSRVTGLTMKQCQSMNKLELMLEHLHKHNSSDIDWVDIAFQFGFSDQPHLIHYLKKHIGSTPKIYEKERILTIDIYGGVGEEL